MYDDDMVDEMAHDLSEQIVLVGEGNTFEPYIKAARKLYVLGWRKENNE